MSERIKKRIQGECPDMQPYFCNFRDRIKGPVTFILILKTYVFLGSPENSDPGCPLPPLPDSDDGEIAPGIDVPAGDVEVVIG